MPMPAVPNRTLDKAQAAELRERLRGLKPAQAEMMRQVMQLHAAGDKMMATQWLLQLAAEAPTHPEVLLWQGLRHMEARDWPLAADCLARSVAQRPTEFKTWAMLGSAQGFAGDAAAAQSSLARAAALARSADEWLRLSIECDQQGFYEEALAAVQAHLRLLPRSTVGLLQRARACKALGQADQAAADCRALIAADRDVARAWFALVDLKTISLSDTERETLQHTAARAALPAADRQLLDFALGKALEDAGDHAGALAALQRANGSVRAAQPWDALAFASHLAALMAAFDTPRPHAQAQAQGGELIFLVGMPRSGSTLVEQVLASHSMVEGASELPYLPQIIEAESRRRGKPFPAWVPDATADDWTRLGQAYLQASARWRRQRPVSTDKLPDNWRYVGALRAMLPQARIIDCRRDALETCWSCYKQLFGPGLANFSYDYDSLAQYWRGCENLGNRWAASDPSHVRIQHYEALVAEPEAQIRALLDFCGLPFEAGCLAFHTAQRAIRTPSALQVRQPMRQTSTPGEAYGALLDPLRAALAAAEARTDEKKA